MLRQPLFRIALTLLVALTVAMSAAPAIARADTGRELEQAEDEPFS